MNDAIEALCRSITNIFEVDDPAGDYSYVEDLDDGRGFTVTHYGFCENTGDLKKAIKLSGFGTTLRLSDDRDRFPERWKQTMAASASRAQLIAACDAVAEELYWTPAIKAATEDGLSANPFACALYYDTLIQHGGGKDPDSFYAIRKQSNGDLAAFLDVRRRILMHATDPDTRVAWRESVDRVTAFDNLFMNQALKGDLRVSGKRLRGLP